MEDTLTAAVVFGGIYFLIKVLTDFLLKRKLIITGQVEKTEILESSKDKERNTYPTLKWGLVVLFAGLGLLAIALTTKQIGSDDWYGHVIQGYMSAGIELIAISLGFLIYFIIARFSSKKE
jgi:di/tricarboxylate transporter